MKGRIFKALTIVAILVLVVTMATQGQAVRQTFGWVIANQLTVKGTSELTGTVTTGGDATIGDDLTVTDGLTAVDVSVSDDLAVTDDASIGGLLTLSAATSITVTNGAAFTPTATYQPIAAAGAVTPTITVLAAGARVVIVNTSNQTVNLADTGTAKLTAAFAMGQYDLLELLSDGTNWLEVGRSNN